MRTKTRALSVFLALALILALFGGSALAEDAAWLPEAMVEEQSFELEEETLTVFPPLYPEGACPMTPPVFPNTGASELEDPEEPERWDL